MGFMRSPWVESRKQPSRAALPAAREDCPFARKWGPSPLQGVDVGHDVGDGFVVRQRRDHRAHLRSVDVALVGAAYAGAEVLELLHEVPVRTRGQGWRVQRLTAFALGAMAGR